MWLFLDSSANDSLIKPITRFLGFLTLVLMIIIRPMCRFFLLFATIYQLTSVWHIIYLI